MSGTFLYWIVVKKQMPRQITQWLPDRLDNPEEYETERLLPDPVCDQHSLEEGSETDITAY